MLNVVVVCEGQTEDTFVREVLARALWDHEISLERRLMQTSTTGRGGGLTPERVVRYLSRTLRQRTDTHVTTFFDLYGLPDDFPGVKECAGYTDPLRRALEIEKHLAAAVVEAAGCRLDRFLPHIQPYEFEALVFADVSRIIDLEPAWRAHLPALRAARVGVASPEHINDGPTTHPSARLTTMLKPRYDKVLHGPMIADHIGLAEIRKECAHFARWLERLEELKPL